MELRNAQGLTEKEFLETYKPGDYERPSVTADILLFTIENKEKINERTNDEKDLKVLLIKRNNHPYMNKWALPGGFVGMDEDIETSAYRELKEETNISENVYLEQLYTFSNPNRDPRMRVISTAYMALTPATNVKKTLAGDDACDANWFTIRKTKVNENDINRIDVLEIINKDLNIHMKYDVTYSFANKKTIINKRNDTNGELAFDHIDIVNMGLTRLRNKVNYTSVAFNLLPELFTLTDLQQVYEILLGEILVKPNFRKKIQNMVIKTEFMKETVGYHRPYLYKKNPKYIE